MTIMPLASITTSHFVIPYNSSKKNSTAADLLGRKQQCRQLIYVPTMTYNSYAFLQ
jgi:hypothetical protein